MSAQKQIRSMVLRYQPLPLDSDVILLRAAQSSFYLDADLGWKRLVKSLEVLDFDENHALILNEINSARIARRIEDAFVMERNG